MTTFRNNKQAQRRAAADRSRHKTHGQIPYITPIITYLDFKCHNVHIWTVYCNYQVFWPTLEQTGHIFLTNLVSRADLFSFFQIFMYIFCVHFYFKSQYVYCIFDKSVWKLYQCLANSIPCILIPDMWVFELWYTFYLIIQNSNAKNISIDWKLIPTIGVHFSKK